MYCLKLKLNFSKFSYVCCKEGFGVSRKFMHFSLKLVFWFLVALRIPHQCMAIFYCLRPCALVVEQDGWCRSKSRSRPTSLHPYQNQIKKLSISNSNLNKLDMKTTESKHSKILAFQVY